LSAIFGGAAMTNVRALRATDNTPTIFFAFSVGGALVSIPFVLGSWTANPSPWIFALVAALVALLAQMLMTEAYGALSVAEAALWQQLTPVMSYLMGMFIGERVTPLAALGVAVSIFGIVYGSVLGTEKKT
jgi:drug/metabolite transporter (DMT)-like permease